MNDYPQPIGPAVDAEVARLRLAMKGEAMERRITTCCKCNHTASADEFRAAGSTWQHVCPECKSGGPFDTHSVTETPRTSDDDGGFGDGDTASNDESTNEAACDAGVGTDDGHDNQPHDAAQPEADMPVATEGKAKKARKTKSEQQELGDFREPDPKFATLCRLAKKFQKIKSERDETLGTLKQSCDEAEQAVLDEMSKLGIEEHTFRGYTFTRVAGKTKVAISRERDDEDGDDDAKD